MNYPDIFDTFLDSVFVINKDKQIVYCNPISTQLTGLSQKRILKSDDLSSVIHFLDTEDQGELNTGKYHELSYKCPNGTKGTARVLWQDIRELNHTIIILQDTTLEITLCNKYKNELEEKQKVISELEQAKSQLDDYNKNLEQIIEKKTQELEAAHKELIRSEKLASLGVMTAGIAHEVNNPLTLIVAPLEVIISDLEKSGKDPALLNRTKKILSSAIRITNIISDMSKFTRNDIIEKRNYINLKEVIELVVLKNQIRLDDQNIKIDLHASDDFPTIQATTHLFEIIIEEFINNSIHSFEEVGADIQKKIDINLFVEDDQPILTFTDNAAGMDEKTQNSLFDPFYTTKEVGKGKGLGLSVAYGIIRRHQADISVTSKVGEGSLFTIKFNKN